MAKKQKNFEESLKRLQAISKKLESDEIELEESLSLYEEGIILSKVCYGLLEKAELKVTELKLELENSINSSEK